MSQNRDSVAHPTLSFRKKDALVDLPGDPPVPSVPPRKRGEEVALPTSAGLYPSRGHGVRGEGVRRKGRLFFPECLFVGENVEDLLGRENIPIRGHASASMANGLEKEVLVVACPEGGIGEVRGLVHQSPGGGPLPVPLDSVALNAEGAVDLLPPDRIPRLESGLSHGGRSEPYAKNPRQEKSYLFFHNSSRSRECCQCRPVPFEGKDDAFDFPVSVLRVTGSQPGEVFGNP